MANSRACPSCGTEVAESAAFCPECGAVQPLEAAPADDWARPDDETRAFGHDPDETVADDQTLFVSAPNDTTFLPRAEKSGARRGGVVIAILIVVALIIGGVWAFGNRSASATVRFLDAGEAAPKPFRTDATIPGFTGGRPDDAAEFCDAETMASDVTSSPTKRDAFAEALRTSDISGLLGRMIPAVLTTDTRVTAYEFAAPGIEPYQAILEEGTYVLIGPGDQPAVRCHGAVPLSEAEPVEGAECIGCPEGYEPPPPNCAGCYEAADFATPSPSPEPSPSPSPTPGKTSSPTSKPKPTPTKTPKPSCPPGKVLVGGSCQTATP